VPDPLGSFNKVVVIEWTSFTDFESNHITGDCSGKRNAKNNFFSRRQKNKENRLLKTAEKKRNRERKMKLQLKNPEKIFQRGSTSLLL